MKWIMRIQKKVNICNVKRLFVFILLISLFQSFDICFFFLSHFVAHIDLCQKKKTKKWSRRFVCFINFTSFLNISFISFISFFDRLHISLFYSFHLFFPSINILILRALPSIFTINTPVQKQKNFSLIRRWDFGFFFHHENGNAGKKEKYWEQASK